MTRSERGDDDAAPHSAAAPGATMLEGVRVVEVADEQAEYCGLLLAGLGADVIKVEPPGGNSRRGASAPSTRTSRIPSGRCSSGSTTGRSARSCWTSTPRRSRDVAAISSAPADVVLDSTPAAASSDDRGLALETLRDAVPAPGRGPRLSPFGDDGPVGRLQGIGPGAPGARRPDDELRLRPAARRHYDLPPIAPQMWQAYPHRRRAAGDDDRRRARAAPAHGQGTASVVRDARGGGQEHRAGPDELGHARDRRCYRQTCRHAAESVSRASRRSPTPRTVAGSWLSRSADGRNADCRSSSTPFGMDEPLCSDFEGAEPASCSAVAAPGAYIPGSSRETDLSIRCHEALQRLVRKFSFENARGARRRTRASSCAPLRRPEENVDDRTGAARRHLRRGRASRAGPVVHLHHRRSGCRPDVLGGRAAGAAPRRGRGDRHEPRSGALRR